MVCKSADIATVVSLSVHEQCDLRARMHWALEAGGSVTVAVMCQLVDRLLFVSAASRLGADSQRAQLAENVRRNSTNF